jgi:hypothetical protein
MDFCGIPGISRARLQAGLFFFSPFAPSRFTSRGCREEAPGRHLHTERVFNDTRGGNEMAVIILEIDESLMAFLEHNAQAKEFPDTTEYLVHVMRLGVLSEFSDVWEDGVQRGPSRDETKLH